MPAATAGEDFVERTHLESEMVTFAANEDAVACVVVIEEDTKREGDEAIDVILTSPSSTFAVVGPSSTTVITITDNEGGLCTFIYNIVILLRNTGNVAVNICTCDHYKSERYSVPFPFFHPHKTALPTPVSIRTTTN